MATTRDPNDSPTVWFAVLERARLTSDVDLERRARRNLQRLGVAVIFDSFYTEPFACADPSTAPPHVRKQLERMAEESEGQS